MRTFFILCAIFPCAAQVITLKHTSCFGSCPVYSLQIDSPGTVSYEGVQYVATIGRRTSSITPAQFQALVSGFTKIGFFELKVTRTTASSREPPRSWRPSGHLRSRNCAKAILSTKNLDAADETGWTALMLAAICEHADAVSMLLNAGAAPNQ